MYKFAINRPISTLMLFLAFVIFGILAILKMPINLFPNIDIPLVKITTYADGNLNYIEDKITKKLEDELSTIDGIDKINSYSYDNLSVILVQFNLDKNLEIATNDIRDKISKTNFSSEIEKLSAEGGSILNIFVTAKQEILMDKIDNVIDPFLRRIEGVGDLDFVGFKEPQIRIDLNQTLLKKYNITSSEISQIIKNNNFSSPLGKFENSDEEILLKSNFDAKNLEDLRNLRIMPGVFLKNLADIKFGFSDSDSLSVMNDKFGAMISVLKVNSANSLQTIDHIKQNLPKLQQILGNEIELKITFDKSQKIKKYLSQVVFDMIFGIILTNLIVFLFLRNLRATIIAGISIPVSIISTFFIIYILGFDLNRLTLIALTLGIGIFIDDAIVVIENISKKLQNENPLMASFLGIKEIAFSVFAISLVLLCVFVPIAFMQSIPGRYFNAFALSVSGGILISFFVALMLIPMISSRFLKEGNSKFYKLTEPFFINFENLYEKLLSFILKFRYFVVLGVVIFTILSAVLATRLGMEFLPMEDDSEFEILLESTPNTSLSKMTKLSKEAMNEIQKDENVEFIYLLLGYTDAKEAYKSKIFVRLKPLSQRQNRQKKIIEIYREKFKFDNLKVRITELPKVESAGISEPIILAIMGDDFTKLDEISKKAKEILQNTKGVVDIKLSSEDQKSNIEISIDKEMAKKLNINISQVASQIYQSFASNIVGSFSTPKKEFDIVMRFGDDFRKNYENLQNFTIKNANGDEIFLSSFADFKLKKSAVVINHFDKQREVLITANIINRPLSDVQNTINQNLKNLPQGYSYKFLGFVELMDDTKDAFIMTILLSSVLIYLILASLYESFILPLIIMATMPLAFCGVSVGLFLSGNSFSIFVMIGLILLFGMVGKNAILVVDFANRLAKSGEDLQSAIIQAGKMRLRAIFMTTFAMIFAMLPLAVSQGSGFEGNSPMAICVICGLISSTILTLLIVPAIFEIVYKLDLKLRKFYEKEKI